MSLSNESNGSNESNESNESNKGNESNESNESNKGKFTGYLLQLSKFYETKNLIKSVYITYKHDVLSRSSHSLYNRYLINIFTAIHNIDQILVADQVMNGRITTDNTYIIDSDEVLSDNEILIHAVEIFRSQCELEKLL